MRNRQRAVFIASFLAPAFLIYALFVVVPLVQAFALSLYQWKGVSAQKKFVGIDNFRELWEDVTFWIALKNNLVLLAGCGIAVFVISIAVALALQKRGPMQATTRGVVLFPQVLSLVVVSILWMFLLNPTMGLVNSGLEAVGLPELSRPWLGEKSSALGSVGVAFVWYAVGFFVLLFVAGLQAIPAEVEEAANLDGSVGWHRFWNIRWPLLWPVRRVAATYVVILVMNIFALVFLMTQGGPDRSTEVMLSYLYQQAFTNSKFGYATAIAVVNFSVAMLLSFAIQFWYRRDPQGVRR